MNKITHLLTTTGDENEIVYGLKVDNVIASQHELTPIVERLALQLEQIELHK